MYFLFQWIGSAAKWLFGAVVTPLANLRHKKGAGRIARLLVHGLVVLLILAGLGWANYYFELDTMLRTPLPLLRHAWLPAMFALIYSLLWLGWYVCRAILSDDESSPHLDIDQAWQEAADAVRQAGIDLARTPLYLLVGQPQGTVNDLIRAAGVSLVTPPVPAAEKAPPLQVFANRDAVYVSCAHVSLLGRQAQLFASAPTIGSPKAINESIIGNRDNELTADADVELDDIPYDYSSQSEAGGTATAVARRAQSVTHAGLSLVEEQVAALVADYDAVAEVDFDREFQPAADLDPLTKDLAAALLHDPEEAEKITARLEHLCYLIREERHPHVPVHGIATLLPAAAADCEAASHHVGELARRDLEAIHRVMETHCPHVALVCDLEQTPGGDSLLTRFPAEQRQRRLGVRLPEPTDNDLHTLGETLDQRMHWLCESLLTPLAYRLIEAAPEQAKDRETLRGNLGLYRFLFRMRSRCERLAITLRRMSALEHRETGSLAGCYLVASGSDSTREHGFAEAVFAQLPQLTSTLAWSESALAADRRQLRLARLGYAALTIVTVSLAVLMLAV